MTGKRNLEESQEESGEWYSCSVYNASYHLRGRRCRPRSARVATSAFLSCRMHSHPMHLRAPPRAARSQTIMSQSTRHLTVLGA